MVHTKHALIEKFSQTGLGGCVSQRKHSCFPPSSLIFKSRLYRDFFFLLFSWRTVLGLSPSSAYTTDFANAVSDECLSYVKKQAGNLQLQFNWDWTFKQNLKIEVIVLVFEDDWKFSPSAKVSKPHLSTGEVRGKNSAQDGDVLVVQSLELRLKLFVTTLCLFYLWLKFQLWSLLDGCNWGAQTSCCHSSSVGKVSWIKVPRRGATEPMWVWFPIAA